MDHYRYPVGTLHIATEEESLYRVGRLFTCTIYDSSSFQSCTHNFPCNFSYRISFRFRSF